MKLPSRYQKGRNWQACFWCPAVECDSDREKEGSEDDQWQSSFRIEFAVSLGQIVVDPVHQQIADDEANACPAC